MTYTAPQFMTHAAPETIEAAIREAEATRDRYAKKASVLRGLLATRHDQIKAGTWPGASEDPKPDPQPSEVYGPDNHSEIAMRGWTA